MKEITITRNNIPKVFSPTKVKKGKSAGDEFLAPTIKATTFEELLNELTFIGLDESAQIIRQKIRQMSKGWTDEATEEAKDENGVVNEDKFAQVFSVMASDFSARGDTIKELQARIAELVDDLTSLDYTNADDAVKAGSIAMEIKKLQTSMQLKRRTKDEEPAPTPA